MNYFGTNLDECGHYYWIVEGNSIYKDYGRHSDDYPFNPENMPYYGEVKSRILGFVKFFRIDGYVICAIYGSCYDKRGGCKSVFFTKEKLTNEEMKNKILSIPIAVKMFDQMKTRMGFEVDWEGTL